MGRPWNHLARPKTKPPQKLTKLVIIEALSQDNKRVINRWRFLPPEHPKTGRRQRFTEKGVEQVLDDFVASFDRDNPNHRYCMVVCTDKYRLVWTPEEEPDAVKETVPPVTTRF